MLLFNELHRLNKTTEKLKMNQDNKACISYNTSDLKDCMYNSNNAISPYKVIVFQEPQKYINEYV